MKKTRFIVLFLLLMRIGFSQDVVSHSIVSSAGYFVNQQHDVNLSWNIGQTIIGTFYNNDLGVYLLSGYEVPGSITGIPSNNLKNDEINIYPNPFVNSIKIDCQNKRQGSFIFIKIYDLSGKAILSTEKLINNDPVDVNLEKLNSGMYLISTIFNNETVNKILIKQ